MIGTYAFIAARSSHDQHEKHDVHEGTKRRIQSAPLPRARFVSFVRARNRGGKIFDSFVRDFVRSCARSNRGAHSGRNLRDDPLFSRNRFCDIISTQFNALSSLKPIMPLTYQFKDSKTSDTVAKALLFIAKFSKKQAMVKFGDTSVTIIWGGSPRWGYYINAGATSFDMFKKSNQTRHVGIDHYTIIQVDPSILGKTLKSNCGQQERNVSLGIIRPNKVKVQVEYADASKRVITHTIPCDLKTLDEFKTMLITEVEASFCRFNTRSYVDNIFRFKHIMDSFVRLNITRVYIKSQQSNRGTNDLTVNARTHGSNICVSLSDLEDGYSTMHCDDDLSEFGMPSRRSDAGVNVETKRLAAFIGGLAAQKRSKVSFDIEHNKCLKITLDHEISQGEKIYQSLLLLHSLI